MRDGAALQPCESKSRLDSAKSFDERRRLSPPTRAPRACAAALFLCDSQVWTRLPVLTRWTGCAAGRSTMATLQEFASMQLERGGASRSALVGGGAALDLPPPVIHVRAARNRNVAPCGTPQRPHRPSPCAPARAAPSGFLCVRRRSGAAQHVRRSRRTERAKQSCWSSRRRGPRLSPWRRRWGSALRWSASEPL